MVEAYRETDKLRKQRINAEAHLQGLYFYEAMCDVSPVLHAFCKKDTKPLPYRAEPYALSDEEEQTPEQRAIKEKNEEQFARAYMMQMDMVGKNWGKDK